MIIRNSINITRFPKIRVPPNHEFHYKPPSWGIPIYGHLHIYIYTANIAAMAPSQLDSGVNNRPRLTLWTLGITDPVILIISINIPSWFSRDPCSVKCVTSFVLFVDFSYQMNLRVILELLVTSPRFHIPGTSFWRNYPSFPREILQEVPEALPLPARWPSRSRVRADERCLYLLLLGCYWDYL